MGVDILASPLTIPVACALWIVFVSSVAIALWRIK